MALTVTHTFVSAIADQGDPALLGPNEWNAAHTITGAASAVTEDTIANILLLTPTASEMAFATDIGVMLVADGTNWQIDSSYYTVLAGTPDIGGVAWSNRIGYGKDYVTDKLLANVTIAQNNDGTTDGDIRFNPDIGSFGAFQQYSAGAWHSVVVGLVLTEQDDMSQAITQTPIGKTEEILVFNGDSTLLGLNGVPIEQGYIATMGAYPALQLVSGGTF